jgi:hypothetical protein
MKVMIKVPFVFMLLFMIVSCATTTTPRTIPEKYNLDDELERVDQIFTIKNTRWQEVDDQSVILRVNWSDYYLVVLRRPMDTWYSNPSIRISNTGTSITAGIDRVYVAQSPDRQGYIIERIYKLKGREQAEEIKKRFGED